MAVVKKKRIKTSGDEPRRVRSSNRKPRSLVEEIDRMSRGEYPVDDDEVELRPAARLDVKRFQDEWDLPEVC